MRLERDAHGDYVVDAVYLAAQLSLTPEAFRRRQDLGQITSRVEAGEGDDAGSWRLTIRAGGAAWQAIVDGNGEVIREVATEGAPLAKLVRRAMVPPLPGKSDAGEP
ncbi:DUF6522 family protein [Azorhizobium doebereinerae]|uniref:DUF6522 family protein n=1 Tax=Azorhizobium doebereinerae TaxID=281091 RepID=UPI0004150727|nr:DUF6522 family protein [Azorhizobium doebereinerae]